MDGMRQPRSVISAAILAKIADGRLPKVALTRVWASDGGGQICDGCDQRIYIPDILYEVDLANAVTLRFHAACFDVWQDALERPR